MRWILYALAVCLTSGAYAAPAEDHWTSEGIKGGLSNYAKARALIDEERFGDALPVLVELSETQPGFADVWSLLGFAYRKTGALEESGKAYRRALGLDPYHRGALEYQGELFLMLGNPARAEANLRRLEMLCVTGCEELDELAAEISAWEALNRN
jgi:Flp pilus assembly protein TadD